jgi:phenylalanyl-tRNA synthetase alpha chain
MKEEIQKIKSDLIEKISIIQNTEDLEDLKTDFLGRKGSLTDIFKQIKDLPNEAKKEAGQSINEAKKEAEVLFDQKARELKSGENGDVETDFDYSIPGTKFSKGTLHPVTQIKNELNDAFKFLGFEIYEGPEISSEKYAFDNMNFPQGHPARESMDTYWVNSSEDEKLCLRPHLTGASIRFMQEHEPPFRFVYPGRVFRAENVDASHERCFYQYEALIVNKDMTFAGGKVLVKTILERVFKREIKVRMRSGFFPFVEPGFEIDMECLNCGGKGCSICKGDGWLEVMPGGVPHPNVLLAGGIDPEKWQGFYINIGLDRLVMMKYGIDDIRLLHSGNLKFLKQF